MASRLRRIRRAVRYEGVARSRRAPLVEGQVLYESFSGNGMLDHPEALFRTLRAAPDLGHLRHVWALSDLDAYRDTVRAFDGDDRVSFVRTGSPRYDEALARSQYLVNNATFPPQFGKRPGQVYVNTWHGVPLKAMGYDVPGGGPATRNIVRNFAAADWLLSANDFMTERMYLSAYKLRGLYRGRIVQEGSPRIDRQLAAERDRAAVREQLAGRGLRIEPGQQLVLYAPTWKGDFYAPLNDAMQLRNRIARLERMLDGRHRVLLKVHQRVHDFAAAQPELRGLLVPNDLPTNLVLAAADVLVTDYSSVFFDFLVSGRPVLFHCPDEQSYATGRGLYLGQDELPGPVSVTLEQLAGQLHAIGTGTGDDPLVSHAEGYARARQRFCPREDGRAAERVVDAVWRGRTDGLDVRRDFSDGRTSILVHLGGMRSNGITKSALALLDGIDHERFDVSAFYQHSNRAEKRRNEAAINPAVRLFPRIGGINGSKLARFGRQAMLERGLDGVSPVRRRAQNRLFRDEWLRCFGDSRFDHVVDFSGYSPFWTYVLLQGEAGRKSIFLHNDLMADSQREVDGRRPHESNLRSVFSTYRHFDSLVSVSPALADINREKLSGHARPERFVSALNTVDAEDVLGRAYGRRRPGGGPVARHDLTGVDLGDLPGTVDALLTRHPIDQVVAEAERRDLAARLLPAAGERVFVTAGRLSPEKDHALLIRAFDLVHRDHPGTHLVILGGGPLADRLQELVAELGLATAVTLAGHQANPHAVMAGADCFVLSSRYEGQPMVLLEAMVLGLPIVTTEFASVRGAVGEGQGLVVPPTAAALAAGMRAFLRGEVAAPPFDADAYNHAAIGQFYRAIGATEPPARPAVVIDLRSADDAEPEAAGARSRQIRTTPE